MDVVRRGTPAPPVLGGWPGEGLRWALAASQTGGAQAGGVSDTQVRRDSFGPKVESCLPAMQSLVSLPLTKA